MVKSLAEQLATFANPEPEDFDPEDLERNSDASNSENEEARAHYVEVGKSRLRDNAPEVQGPKYKGARVSRRDLELINESQDGISGESSDEQLTDDSEGSESQESEDISDDDENGLQDSEEEDLSEIDSEDDSSSEEASHNTNGASNGGSKSAAVAAILQQEQKQLVNRLSQTAQADIAKGKAIQAQMSVYEGLLDGRIRLQKVLNVSNTLVDADYDSARDALDAVLELLNSITKVRHSLIRETFTSKKRSYSDFVAEAAEADSKLAERRESVLAKWSRKVQLSSGSSALQTSKFKSLNQSAATQVNTVLADMPRLVKRTQVNRSQYEIDGVVPEDSEKIFDDTDFYRLLLKDLVDRRMAESGNATGLKWSTVKTKTKKGVDTKASKGRKLRYHVQEKVQGFDAPREVFTWTDEQAEELFSHLLGQSISMDDKEPEGEIDIGDLPLFG